MHTLLPHSASELTTPNQHQADWEIRRLRVTLSLGPRRRLHYGEAQAQPPSMYGQRLSPPQFPTLV